MGSEMLTLPSLFTEEQLAWLNTVFVDQFAHKPDKTYSESNQSNPDPAKTGEHSSSFDSGLGKCQYLIK